MGSETGMVLMSELFKGNLLISKFMFLLDEEHI